MTAAGSDVLLPATGLDSGKMDVIAISSSTFLRATYYHRAKDPISSFHSEFEHVIPSPTRFN